jgi:TatD family-associated radical SAM protein
MKYNLGKLKKKLKPQQNIIYYRKKKDEISLNITNRCPNACCFCIRDRDKGWGVSNLYLLKEPSLEEIKDEIKRELMNSKQPIKKFKICGYGEPILRIKILPELILFIKKVSPNSIIQLTTTGWPLFHFKKGIGYFKQAVKNGLNLVYVGIHATNFSDYAKRVNPSINPELAFYETKEFIKLSSSLNLKITCAFVDLRDLNLAEIKNFAKKLNCLYDIRGFEK